MKTTLGVLALLALGSCKEAPKAKPSVDDAPVAAPKATSSIDAGVKARKIPKLVRAQPLSTEALMALQSKMLNHGDDMENLLWSTLMLDYESTSAIAAEMAKAPTLARAGVGQEDTINAFLPEEFFELQDQLTSSIAGLRSAALARHDGAIATEYAKVASTCIQCHSLYLRFPTSHGE
jgi:hypothetical protein